MKVLFLGSPKFSVEILKRVLNSNHEVVAVVTQPDRPSGRGHKLLPTDVKAFAKENNIKVFDFEKVCEHIEEIKKVEFDISVTASFGQILRDNFLSLAPCINVHPSLLPKYRGATPIQSALLAGDNATGVTIMNVVRAVDAGAIYAQQKVKIEEDDNYTSLEKRLVEIGGDLLIDVLDKFEKGEISSVNQDEEKATFCKKVQKEDCFLDLNSTATELVNKSRALNEYGVYLMIDGQRLKVQNLKDVSSEFCGKNFEPCNVIEGKKRFVLSCKNGAIEVLSCQSKSGKMVSGKDFLNGFNIEGKKINI